MIRIKVSDPKNIERTMEETAGQLLDLIWQLTDTMDLCPICLMMMMQGMVEEAKADGRIHHTGEMPFPDPIVKTVQ
jgi:hypothetical protein